MAIRNIRSETGEMYARGFYAGDGCRRDRRGYHLLVLCGKKTGLAFKFSDFAAHVGKTYRDRLYGTPRLRMRMNSRYGWDKSFVPCALYSAQDKLDYLAGLIDSDGYLHKASNAVRITSVNLNLLGQVQSMLAEFSCFPKIHIHCRGGTFVSHSRIRGTLTYRARPSYRLCINNRQLKILKSCGLKTYRVKI